MGTDRTGAGITGTDTMDAALAGVDITGKPLAGMNTMCAVTGPAAIIGPGITTRPTCTLHMFTYLASTCTSCFLCTDGRTNTEPFD